MKALLVLIFSFGIYSNGFAFQNYKISDIPQELLKSSKTIIRSHELQFEVKDNKLAYEQVKVAITFLKAHEAKEDLIIHYSGGQYLKKIKASIYDKDGMLVRSLKQNEIQDYSAVSDFSIYEDSRLKHLSLKHSSYPYTVVYEYEKVWNNIYTYPNWNVQTFSTAIQSATYRLIIPAKNKLQHKFYNTEVQAQIETTNKKISYTWRLNNLKAIQKESYHPPTHKIFPLLFVTPSEIEIGKYKGSYKDWNSYSQFRYRLNEGRDVISESLIAEIKSLTKDLGSDKEKIEALYNYLQEQTRYVSVQLGIGGWQTFDAQYVEKNKYGDCKALTNFTKSMLKEIGISANAVSIYNGLGTMELDQDFTHPYSNHVILYVPSEDLWLECTSSYSPPGYIGIRNADKNCLLIAGENGGLIRTPKQDQNELNHKIHTTYNEDGSAACRINTKRVGYYQESLRPLLKKANKAEIEEYFYENLNLTAFELKDYAFEVDEQEAIVETDIKVEIKRLANKTGKRLFIPINTLSKDPIKLNADTNRIFDVYFSYAEKEKESMRIILPEGYKIEAMPESNYKSITDFGAYELNVKKEEDAILIDRTYTRNKGTFAPSKYEELRTFYKEIAKRDKQNIVLVKTD